MQAEDATRRSEADLMRAAVRNNVGRMVRLSEFARARWVAATTKLDRYNGLPSMKISGSTAPGISNNKTITTIKTITQQLPPNIDFK